MDPNVKLLLILRDPIKRLISDYNHYQHTKKGKREYKNKKYPLFEKFMFQDKDGINITNLEVDITNDTLTKPGAEVCSNMNKSHPLVRNIRV